MKQLFLTLAVAMISYGSYAQWSGTSPIYYTGGNVGIGTTSPGAKLHLVEDASAGSAALHLTNRNSNQTWGMAVDVDAVDDKKLMIYDVTAAIARLTINTSGNVGIGTTSPNVPFHVSKYGNNVTGNLTLLTTFTDPTGVKGISLGYNQSSQAGIIYSENNTGTGSPLEFWTYNGSSFAPRMVFTQAGNLGISTTSPNDRLEVSGTTRITNPSYSSQYTQLYVSGMVSFYDGNSNSNVYNGVQHIFQEGGTERMRVSTNGNLLIGKTSQTNTGYILDVNGSARANEVVVNTSGADFVFDKKYSLPKLSEVKSYIDVNHHLPEIPSAEQMKKDGLSVGEMNTKLLQKVEELTLYAIATETD